MKRGKKHVVIISVMTLLISLFGASTCKAASNDIEYCGDFKFKKTVAKTVEADGKNDLSSGNVYYVSKSGKDSWKGTEKKPFKTIRYALTKLKKGDTLYIKGGTYKEEIDIKSEVAGSSNNYITIANAPGERVILDGTGMDAPKLLDIKGASYLKIQGIEIRNAVGKYACGVRIGEGSHHIILCNLVVHDVKVSNQSDVVGSCNGIVAFGDSAKKSIHDLLFYGNKVYDCETGWAEAMTVTGNVRNANVISNTISNTGNIGIDFAGNYGYCSDPAKDFPVNGLIYGNKVSYCKSKYARAYGIYVDGGQKITIAKNTVEKCTGGIEIGAEQKAPKDKYATSDITVKENMVIDNLEKGITVGGYQTGLGWVKRVCVKDNICKNTGNHAILTLSKCSDVEITGNVFYNSSGDAAVVYSGMSNKYTKNIKFKDNTFYNGHSKDNTYFKYLGKKYKSFEKWLTVVGKDAGEYSGK